MSWKWLSRWALGLGGTVGALLTGPMASVAVADVNVSGFVPCSPPTLSQPFLSIGDPNWYMPAPGQTPDQFLGSGWTLTGGATIVSTQLPDGLDGQVLDLPSGSEALSPSFCITSGYADERAVVRDVVGNEGVQFALIDGTTTDTAQINGGSAGDWTLTDPFALAPLARPGQQRVRLVLTPGGTTSDFQIDGLWLDPRMTG